MASISYLLLEALNYIYSLRHIILLLELYNNIQYYNVHPSQDSEHKKRFSIWSLLFDDICQRATLHEIVKRTHRQR